MPITKEEAKNRLEVYRSLEKLKNLLSKECHKYTVKNIKVSKAGGGKPSVEWF